MKRKPTVFIVSQRTSSIQDADSILVLDDGKIAGKGTHEELIASCDIYPQRFMKHSLRRRKRRWQSRKQLAKEKAR